MAYSYPALPHAPPSRVFPQIPAQDQDQVQKQERRKEKKREGSALSTYGQWLRAVHTLGRLRPVPFISQEAGSA